MLGGYSFGCNSNQLEVGKTRIDKSIVIGNYEKSKRWSISDDDFNLI